jgi:Kef-type K+ transport system membrane component KefB
LDNSLEHIAKQFSLPLSNPVLVFSLILFIILLSPTILGRFKIPGIIGLIISGVIIGPHGLRLLENNSAVALFSTIGLLYIMFIAGLELDLNQFRVNRNRSLVFAIFAFGIPLGIGFPVCRYLLGYDFNASFLTASMFATQTLVAYPIVSRMGLSKNQAVAITVGGTILTDTAVLIILAVIMESSKGSLNESFWIQLGISIAVFLIIMFLGIPRIAKWFFTRLESEKYSHYIFVLCVVFLAAFLAELAGLEPIIGAFAAGLALNRLIPSSSALMNRIEFIGNSLFIPFFLISVGMLVDVSVVLRSPMALIIAGTLTVVALTGKWIASFLTQHIFRYSASQRQLIFGLSSAHAAATLAVIIVGYNAGILDKNILNGTIILILTTCLIASFATEKASRKLAIVSGNDGFDQETASGTSSEHILIPIANISTMEKLLEFGILIKDKKSPSPVSLLTVVPNDEEAEENIARTREKLEGFVKMGSAAETNVNLISAIDHNIAGGIARVSREAMANIITMGWPGRSGVIDRFIGETVDIILASTNKTLFVCHFEKPLATHKRVLLISPSLSERENGFGLWFSKVTQLSEELGATILCYCNVETENFVRNTMKSNKSNSSINFTTFDDWEDFLVLARDITLDDLLVIVSARKGGVSHLGVLDSVPRKLEKHFSTNSRILIYPHQHDHLSPRGGYGGVQIAGDGR